MPVSGEKYVAPVWKDNAPPALDAAELQAMTDAIERTEVSIGDVTTPAQKMGLTGDLSIGKALGVLADVGNVHVWRRTRQISEEIPEVPPGYTLGPVVENVVLSSRATTVSTKGTFYYYYGDSVTVKNDGVVNAPSSDSWVLIGRDTSEATIRSGPLFIKGSPSIISSGSGYQDADITDEAKKVFYIPSSGSLKITVNSSSKMCYVIATKYQVVTGYPYTPAIPAGIQTDFPTSTNPNAYQEGTVGNTTIEYLGSLGDKVKVEVVSYIGTGAGNSSSNPTSLTASFPIKIASYLGERDIAPDDESVISHNIASPYNDRLDTKNLTTEFKYNHGFRSGTSATPYCKKSADGKTLYWYNGSGGGNAFNASGNIYYFLVFG